jgi:hypothetical protein
MLAGESGHASCCPAAPPPFTVSAKMSFRVHPLKRNYMVKRLAKSSTKFSVVVKILPQKESCKAVTLHRNLANFPHLVKYFPISAKSFCFTSLPVRENILLQKYFKKKIFFLNIIFQTQKLIAP